MGLGISMGTKAAQAITVPPVIVSFLGRFPGAVSGLDIGPARNDRLIVVIATGESDAAAAMASATIGAGTVAPWYAPTTSDPAGVAGRFVPASEGSTINISASMRGLAVINVYMVTGISGGLAVGTALTISGANATANFSPAGNLKGAVIGWARSVVSTAGISAATSSGVNFWTLNSGYNQGGGSSPSAGCASGLLDGTGNNVATNIINASGWAGYGWQGLFV